MSFDFYDWVLEFGEDFIRTFKNEDDDYDFRLDRLKSNMYSLDYFLEVYQIHLELSIALDGKWYIDFTCKENGNFNLRFIFDDITDQQFYIIKRFDNFRRRIIVHLSESGKTKMEKITEHERETEEIDRRKKGLYMSQWFPNFLQVFKDTVEHTTLNTENSEPEQAKIWIICSLEILSVKLSLKICFDSQWCVFFACMHEDKHEIFLSFKTLDGQEQTIAENFRKYSTEMYDFFSVEGVSIKGNNTGILDILNEINALLRKAMDRVARSR